MKFSHVDIQKMKKAGLTDGEIEAARTMNPDIHKQVFKILDALTRLSLLHICTGVITSMVQNNLLSIDDVFRLVNLHSKIMELVSHGDD